MKKNILIKILTTSVISLFLIQVLYVSVAEPTVILAAGPATDNVVVTLNVTAGISLSTPTVVTMAPNLGVGINGSVGATSWTVQTNSLNGYTLSLKSAGAPNSLTGTSGSFPDYGELTPGIPEVWTIPATTKEFGYSAFGTNVNGTTWGAAATCGTGGATLTTTGRNYVGLKTTDKEIARSATVTPVAGTITNVCFAAAQNGVFAASGSYSATVTATGVAL